MSARYTELLYKFPAYNEGHVADMSWKSGARAIDKLERHTVVAVTLKQELLKWQYVVFGSECVNIMNRGISLKVIHVVNNEQH